MKPVSFLNKNRTPKVAPGIVNLMFAGGSKVLVNHIQSRDRDYFRLPVIKIKDNHYIKQKALADFTINQFASRFGREIEEEDLSFPLVGFRNHHILSKDKQDRLIVATGQVNVLEDDHSKPEYAKWSTIGVNELRDRAQYDAHDLKTAIEKNPSLAETVGAPYLQNLLVVDVIDCASGIFPGINNDRTRNV